MPPVSRRAALILAVLLAALLPVRQARAQAAPVQPHATTIPSSAVVGPMGWTRMSFTATRLPSGDVLLVGGSIDTSFVAASTAWVFSPATDAWVQAASPPTARHLHTATLLADGRVLVVGGMGNSSTPPGAEIYTR